MTSFLRIFVALILATPAIAAAEPIAGGGKLVIAGGALSRENAAVHGAFLAHVGETGRIAIIPAASGDPVQSAQSYIKTLAHYGVGADRVEIVALAVMDDRSTPETDEARWRDNAASPTEIAKVNAAAGIWMTGGDQARLIDVLKTTAGADTPLLSAMRARLSSGAVIGGTSAGAAVMSDLMIARGDSLAALTQPVLLGATDESTMDGGAMALAPGLGFLPLGVVDQHFDRKARLGRLARALTHAPQAERIGYGVDEDTALVLDLAGGQAQVLGVGSVAILDAREAVISPRDQRFSMRGVWLSLISDGDVLRLNDLSITPNPAKKRIAPQDAYYRHAPQSGAGMALPNPGLEEALGVELLDNRTGRALERVSFDGAGIGVRYRFEETPASWGAFGDDKTGRGRYAISRVRFAIEPVRVTIRSDER